MVKKCMSCGDFEADLYVDPKLHPPIYHYIITRKGEAEILMWGQEDSIEEAGKAAFSWMVDMNGKAQSTTAS